MRWEFRLMKSPKQEKNLGGRHSTPKKLPNNWATSAIEVTLLCRSGSVILSQA